MASIESRAVYFVVIGDGNEIERFGLEGGNSADGGGDGKKCRSERRCKFHLGEFDLFYIEKGAVVLQTTKKARCGRARLDLRPL